MHTPFSLRSTLARLGVLLLSMWACRLGSAPPTPLPGSTAPLQNTPEFQALLQEVFGTADRTSPILRQASPLTYVHPGAPPFLIVQGLADTVVPPDQSQRLAAALQEASVPVEALWVQHGGHGLWPQGGPLQPPLSEITQHVVDFLVQNLGKNTP